MSKTKCSYRGLLGLSLHQAYILMKAKCPECGRVWRVGRERGKALLKYSVNKQGWPNVRLPQHTIQD